MALSETNSAAYASDWAAARLRDISGSSNRFPLARGGCSLGVRVVAVAGH